MLRASERRAKRAESSRAELWRWPGTAGPAALLAALLLSEVHPTYGSFVARLAWPGDVDVAAPVLQTIAAPSITVTTLTLTLTVIALQLASQQFSPRLLRDFIRDRVTKTVLAVLVATLVFAVTVLRGLRADSPVPALALLVASVLAVAALGAVLAFITHIPRLLRVDTMMLLVHDETTAAMAMFYPAHGDPGQRSPAELAVDHATGSPVRADRSGFVRLVDVDGLLRAARSHDAAVWVDARPGDHVVCGTPVARV